MRTKLQSVLKCSQSLLVAAVVLAAAPAHATIELSDSPLFVTIAVPPNVVLTLDDSGSMARAFVPDICGATGNDCGSLDNRWAKSSRGNPLYYNPEVKYEVPKDAAGNDLPLPDFEAAARSGYYSSTSFGSRDLKRNYRPTAYVDLAPGSSNPSEGYMGHFNEDVRCRNSRCQIRNSSGNWLARDNGTVPFASTSCSSDSACMNAGMPAYYYRFNAARSGCGAANSATNNTCYDIVFVTSTSGTTDFNRDGVVDATESDERQNFANWYSYARTRNLATQTGAALAFSELDGDVRVAWQALHTCRNSATNFVDSDCDGWRNNFSNISNRIRPFRDDHKENFYRWVSQLPTNDDTPLPAAMQRAGEYFRRNAGQDNNPYDSDLENGGSVVELSCRRNYHVMMTDGIWNDAVSVTGGNLDNATVTLPEAGARGAITEYTARSPYRDDHSNTLADLAFFYWITDLRSGLANDLQVNYRDTSGTEVQNFWNVRNDPATWQHMVNFTIGLGLTGYLAQESLTWDTDMYRGSFPQLEAGTTAWPAPGAYDPANVADLWHAAINSRGQFFSADDPTSLAVAFRSALTAITRSSGSSAALSANSTSIQPDNTFVYQAKFDASDWSGTVLALSVDEDGAVNQTPVWDAAAELPSEHDDRSIFTFNGTAGTAFSSCSNLSSDQALALGTNVGGIFDGLCDARLEWLRGDDARELRNGGTFRNRPRSIMGDVINSDPGYVRDVDYGYAQLPGTVPGASSYDAYRSGNASRTPMVYVGSNDGQMHAFNAANGEEQFAYVPAGVYSGLSALTDPSYTHRYYVDGPITVGDAYLDGSWRTMLVAGLNAGGKSVYALDVTNPTSFAASDVKWEFTEADMGYTYSQPQIGVLESGEWVAVFGNGYNSTGGGAHLYIVNLETGSLIRKITASDASGDESNGLSTPLLFDADEDRLIDSIYAGDLHGNLWKFDLSSTASSSWGVAYGGPLFSSGVAQPITAQPKAGDHPEGGHLIVFGTGRYLAPSDVGSDESQSFYGIWDNGAAIGGAPLLSQDLRTRIHNGRNVRTVTSASPNWTTDRGWRVRLPASGERSVSTPLIFRDRVIFVTIVPNTDPCSPGGSSWLMELNFQTGGSFNGTILDLDNDGSFQNDGVVDEETGTSEIAVGVELSDMGISKTPALLAGEEDLFKVVTGTSGMTGTFRNCTDEGGGCEPTPPTTPPGVSRRSWIQIR